MIFIITADKAFTKPLATLLLSITKNSKNEANIFYYPYIKGEEDSIVDINYVKKYIKSNDTFIPFSVPETCKINLASNEHNWNYHVWLKLTCLFYLPTKIEKLLYIDCDCIVNGDIHKFYDIDIKECCLCGVNEEIGDNNSEALERIMVKKDGIYICCGVLLINPINFVKEFKNIENMLEIYNNLPFIPIFNEQDFINYYFHNELKPFYGNDYMFFPMWYPYEKNKKYRIIHFAGKPKPWERYTKAYPLYFYNLYYKYGKKTFGYFHKQYVFCRTILFGIKNRCKLIKKQLSKLFKSRKE